MNKPHHTWSDSPIHEQIRNIKTDTPETDAMVSADQHHLEDDNFFSASVYWRICDLARGLERERDEARKETKRTREFMDHGFAVAQAELTTVTEQRDRLAEAIRKHKDTFQFALDFCDVELYEALQYLTPNEL